MMIENVKELFKKYDDLNMPCIISAFVSDGRRVMFVVIGFQGGEIIGITRDTKIPGHFNPATIIEWRDYSNNSSNIISKQEAKDIYEKYVSVKVDSKALDGSLSTEGNQTNGAVENYGTAVEAV